MVDIARTSAFRYALGYVDGLAREYGVEREELRAYAQANCRGLHGIARAFDVLNTWMADQITVENPRHGRQ